jgi:hypothetical protein
VRGWPRAAIRLLAIACAVGLRADPADAQDIIRGNVRPIADSGVQLVVDSRQPLGQVGDAQRDPAYRISGWAADLRGREGPGVRQRVAFLNGPSGSGRLLGWARLGLPRPDVATVFNAPALTPAGFELAWRVADMPIQVELIREHMLYLYLEVGDGWVVTQVPVQVATWADSGQSQQP